MSLLVVAMVVMLCVGLLGVVSRGLVGIYVRTVWEYNIYMLSYRYSVDVAAGVLAWKDAVDAGDKRLETVHSAGIGSANTV